MAGDLDLDAYFARIGYSGERSAALTTLREIHALHPAAIAFENLNPLLRIPVLLDIESLQRKLIESGRGGYCYEHNLLLKRALELLGFEVTGLAARVLWTRPDDAITARTHMLLLVTIDGERYIADVGFGGQTLTAPLRLEPDIVQDTPHEPFRLKQLADEFLLQSLIRGEWRSLYRFDLQPQHLIDYELASWYLCNHPQSHFIAGLRIARSVSGRRHTLAADELSTHAPEGTSSRVLRSVDELREALVNVFGIRLPDHPELPATLSRALRSTSAQ